MSDVALSVDFDGVEGRGGFSRRTVRRLVRQPVTLAAFFVLAVVLGAGALAPVLAKGGWNLIDLSGRWYNHGPTVHGHLFGTDNIGRDVLARVLWGIHASEQTAIVGGIAATLVAAVVGLTAGYFGGWFDAVVMRIADLVTGFPVIVVLIVVFVWLRPVTIWDATIVFAVAMWPFGARVIRAQTVALAAEEYVVAAQALGASNRRILLRHLLPNAAGTIVVTLTALAGQIVLIEATAEFFGFGVASIARPTLGNLIGEATISGIGPYNALGLGWWVWATPMVALVVVLACISLAGDGLDAALNPRG
jgi:peptide/nickel transport system permease protein